MAKAGIILSIEAESLVPQIAANHRECMKCGREAANHAIEAGTLLLKLKESVKHGEFQDAIEKRFEFSVETARLYMRVAEHLPPLIKKLGKDFDNEGLTLRGGLKLIESNKPPKSGKNSNSVTVLDQSKTTPTTSSSQSAEAAKAEYSQPETFANPQGSAPAGNCPRGGDHEWDDDGDCTKCKEPNFGKDQPTPDEPATGAYNAPGPRIEAFDSLDEFRSLMRTLSDCKGRGKELQATPGGEWLDVQEFERLVEQARLLLRFAAPHCECAKCRRKVDKKCPACKGLGWVNESIARGAFSDADKAWVKSL